jgi:hypothetical protein
MTLEELIQKRDALIAELNSVRIAIKAAKDRAENRKSQGEAVQLRQRINARIYELRESGEKFRDIGKIVSAEYGVSGQVAAINHRYHQHVRRMNRAEEYGCVINPDGTTSHPEVSTASPIAHLVFSVRTANCMNNANIQTVGQLCEKTEKELSRYRTLGKSSLEEIKIALAKHGFSLRKE